MKKSLLLLAQAAMLCLFSTGCNDESGWEEPEDTFPARIYASLPAGGINADLNDRIPVPGADVWIYETEEDYLLDKSPIFHDKTDEDGLVEYTHSDSSTLWYRVEKGKLNSYRYSQRDNTCYSGVNRKHYTIDFPESQIPCCGEAVYPILTTYPSKLQLTIFHKGAPVEGADVQLYFSQEAYENDVKAQQDLDNLLKTYGFPAPYNEGLMGRCVKESFLQQSDSEGVVFFNNLEAKTYWFRITKDELSNEGGTIQLEKPLTEDPNITRSITVGIN